MKPFRFRLGRVLRVRQLVEEVARGELAAARADERRAQESVQLAMDGVLSSLRSERACREADAFSPAQSLARERYTERLRETLAQRRSRRTAATRAADAIEARWRERRSDVEALERMRERARDRWIQERFSVEQADADEASLARVARRLKDSPEAVDAGPTRSSNAKEDR